MRTTRLLAAAALCAPLAAAPAQSGTRMLRNPSISTTHVAFQYAQDIWVAPRAGGNARRITSFAGDEINPQISPDGRLVAFSAQYGGNTDVYTVPIDGGEPKRLTWHSGPDVVQGWTPDGKHILFSSTRDTHGPNAAPKFYTIPLEGGIEQKVGMDRAMQGKYSPDGTRIAYRMNTSWDDERRNYKGGQNRPIWIMDVKSLDVTEARPWTDTKDIDPTWIGNTVYFISDRDGVANVWSYDTQSKQMEQVTRFRDYDVKSLDSDLATLVIEQAGYLHTIDPASKRATRLDITATGDFPWMMPQWKDVSARMSSMALSPSGARAVVEARGEIFTVPAQRGDVRNLTNSSRSAERQPAWSPDGKWISYFSDSSGEYTLILRSADGNGTDRSINIPAKKFYYTPEWSPDSRKLLFHDTDLNLWVTDIASGNSKIVGRDPWMVPQRTMNPRWSPDSKYIAYSANLNSLYRAIFVADAETGKNWQISDGLADAVWPTWDKSGKYLWFMASTDYGLRSQWLDMSAYPYTPNYGLYIALLSKTETTPFPPQSDEEGAAPAAGAGGRGAAAGAGGRGAAAGEEAAAAAPAPRQAAVTVTIDFDGIQKRILSVAGVPERAYSRLQAGVAGSVFYSDAGNIMRYQLSTRSAAVFTAGGDFTLSADGRKMLYRAGGGGGGGRGGAGGAAAAAGPALHIVDADRAAPAAGAGRVANTTLRMYHDPKAEFEQIFNEGWRLQRDYLYVQNAHGSDWPAMKKMYGELLPHVRHRADLNYLLDQMGAEIAVGHSYVRGGEMPETPGTNVPGGHLGADFVIENGRYKITRILESESWNPDLRAPLAEPGVDVRVGDYIIAVNGEELRAPDNLYRLLDGTANRQITLHVNTTASMTGARKVTVVPVANDQGLRTRAWIEGNRRKVDELSGGKLAYVHLPNTGQGGYTNFNRYYFAQQDKQGAVIDERFNGGGQAADYIIDVLGRKFDGYFNNVAGDRVPFTSPSAGIWGPKVMIINEMAGSGGDLMPHMFKLRGIGPLVGKRTWGGLVHTADTPGFIDGGSMIAPRGGFIDINGNWALENTGEAPDIDVENWPKDMAAGRDAQLEAAVKEAMRLLQANPPKRMMTEPAPPTWGRRGGR
jgi:tricorn protease